jgi:hypothetical protein
LTFRFQPKNGDFAGSARRQRHNRPTLRIDRFGNHSSEARCTHQLKPTPGDPSGRWTKSSNCLRRTRTSPCTIGYETRKGKQIKRKSTLMGTRSGGPHPEIATMQSPHTMPGNRPLARS